MTAETTTAAVLAGFDDPRCTAERWNALLSLGGTNTLFLTWEYQRAWWNSFERTGQLLIAAERDGQLIAIAPFFADEGIVYFIGSGGSDYLDFVGDTSDPAVLDLLLAAARNRVPEFHGFQFYHILESSRTGELLRAAAGRLGLKLAVESGMPAPFVDLAGQPEVARAAVERKKLLQVQRTLERDGVLAVEHLSDGSAILPHLGEFMQQHIERWAATPHPSQFLQPAQRTFLEKLTAVAANSDWLRFTRILWNGAPIACHYGFCYAGSYVCYKPAFDVAHSRRSPGQVLMRHLILAAINERAHTFDFGLGDEPYKQRFATGSRHVNNWALHAA
ncbi:MAG: GNAT family N-acetyltransferase [Verrucomicrobiales bacterium]